MSTPIDLESGLDISTSDMLVPLNQQTFQHNWQRYQGKCLPNSLRFEKNGWAADWNVYNFDYKAYREEQNGKYVGLSNFNTYAEMVSVYEKHDSIDSLFDVFIISDRMIIAGNANINDNVITGLVSGKPYSMTWDPDTKTFTDITEGFTVEQTINSDYTITVKVIDDSSYFDFDFNLYLATALTGDQIVDVKFDMYNSGTYNWGTYVFDGTEMLTPEGVTVIPTVTGNLLEFDYSVVISDETLDVQYTMQEYCVAINNFVNFKQIVSDDLLLYGDKNKSFNWYRVSGSVNDLKAGDSNGIVYDMRLPLWLEAGCTIQNEQAIASLCNNCKHSEVAVRVGLIGTNTIAAQNIFTGNITYHPLTNNSLTYLNSLEYRFNKLQPEATIEKGENWQPYKYKINSKVYYEKSLGFEKIRTGNLTALTRALGTGFDVDVYYNPSDDFGYNDCWDSVIATMSDISNISNIRAASDPSSSTYVHDDEAFVEANASKTDYDIFGALKATANIITDPDTELTDSSYQDNYGITGIYTGNNYMEVVFENANVPFKYLPVMKINGTVCFWTNAAGTIVITDPEDFVTRFLGTWSIQDDWQNTVLTEREYNRTRLVKMYKPSYDFNKSSDDDAFDSVWETMYPGYDNPRTYFDDTSIVSNRFDGFMDTETKTGVEFTVNFANPGVYVGPSSVWAVQFRTSSGLILYDNSTIGSMQGFVRHHTVDKSSLYTITHYTQPGRLSGGGVNVDLPRYFGTPGAEQLVAGDTSIPGVFRQRFTTASRTPGSINLYINYSDSYTVQGRVFTPDPSLVSSGAWLKYLHAQLMRGKLTVETFTLNNGVERVETTYSEGDVNKGIKVSCPIWGHGLFRITYPQITSKMTMSPSVVTFTKVDATDTGKVYWDRVDNSVPKAMNLFTAALSTIKISTGSTVEATITLNSNNSTKLYYAEEPTNVEISGFNLSAGANVSYYSPTENLKPVEQLPSTIITGTADIKSLPVNGKVTFSKKNNYSHIFYANGYSTLELCTFSSDPINYDTTNNTLQCSLTVNNNVIQFVYDGLTGITVPQVVNQKVIDLDFTEVTLVNLAGTGDKAAFTTAILLNYNNCTARIPQVSTGYTLTKVDDTLYNVNKGDITLIYDSVKRRIISHVCDFYQNDNIENGQHIIAQGKLQETVTCIMPYVVNGDVTNDTLTFEFDGDTYTVNLNDMRYNSVNNGIDVLSTDIRTPDKIHKIGMLKPDSQYQLLKQRWNTTTEVENFWWVDPTHTLTLTKDKFILERNTKEPDDWNGDRFEKIYEIDRADILDSDTYRYCCTNVYDSTYGAMFFTIREVSGKVLIQFYKLRPKFEEAFSIYLQLRLKDIGQELNDIMYSGNNAYLNTYNPLTAGFIISKAIWSSTIAGNYLVLGCHLSNNYDQWAIVIDLSTSMIKSVTQGYGYVSLHGDLTGGMLPSKYFTVEKGFNSTVQDLEVLDFVKDSDSIDDAVEVYDKTKINYVESKVVGTTEQQWYIEQELTGIVSHVLFNKDNGTFTPKDIPLTNNYSAMYRSPSFGSTALGDILPQAIPFQTLLKPGKQDGDTSAMDVISTILFTAIGYPMLFILAPRYSSFLYLQQSFGQYAYVHYNSSQSMPELDKLDDGKDSGLNMPGQRVESAVLNDSFIFDKQKFTQSIDLSLSYWEAGILAILIPAFSKGLDLLREKTSINEEQNQTAVKDTGRSFGSMALENASNILVSQLRSSSKTDMAGTSIVTGLKSLDMFYSTSEQQRIFAGPGYAEHQYVADCVAQSVTHLNVQGKVQQMFLCLRFLTTLQLNLELIALEYARDLALDVAAVIPEMNFGAFGINVNVGAAAAAVMTGVAGVADATIVMLKACIPAIEQTLDTICANGITSSVFSGTPDTMNLQSEGKHKYGEKNETFMWPCWGTTPGALKYTDEKVVAGLKVSWWKLNQKPVVYWEAFPVASCKVALPKCTDWNFSSLEAKYSSVASRDKALTNDYMKMLAGKLEGQVPYYNVAPYGEAVQRTLPDDMVKIEGVNRFLPDMAFKNENIGMSEPAFTPSMFQDYIIDKQWDLSQCCTYGLQQWVTVKDTKITNCPPSNMYVNDNFCGVATPYSAIEVKRGISKKYMRPWAITPTTLAFNCTGFNCIFDDKLYHAFDGYSYRLVDLVGSPGLGKNRQTFWYSFQKNDRFKRSNKFPANQLQGNFMSDPVQAVNSIDELYTIMTNASKEKGMEGGTIGEDKDATRWALPLFTEYVSTLPAAVKTLTAMELQVHDGITSLCINLGNNQTAYKAPISVDFIIGKQVFRATKEYISSVQTQEGLDILTDLVPILGLTFIGSTPAEAFFYSKSTRCYYSFSGTTITKVDMMERFRDIQKGFWDFVNQEVVMPCLMTYKRLNAEVEDKDTETDNVIVPVMSKGTVSGELPPPITTIFNDRSWYKCVSLPCGFAYQGPNRVIINRSVFVEYMERSIKDNYGKWQKMDREKYNTRRVYPEVYTDVLHDVKGVDGWTYNPFVLVTSPLGQSEDVDCTFEWVITFCWPVEMDLLYGVDNYAVVNIMSETMTPGGKVFARPSHVFLTKELFTRTGNYGYYTFRYQGKNGAGNRERLHIWSDQYIAISALDCNAKPVTQRRTEQLTQQVDVQRLKEL